MKCVHTLETGRHKRQADITLLFQYMIMILDFIFYRRAANTNCVDPDEMSHYAAFHLQRHCWQKYIKDSSLYRVFIL